MQYGDALLTSPETVVSQYNRLEWNELRSLAGLPAALLPTTPREWRMFAELQAESLLDELTKRAIRPPTDSQQICDIVSQDRKKGTIMAKKKDTAPADATTTVEGSTTTSNLPAQARGPKNVPADAIITMGKDKDGKDYGPDNNPKKVGSKTHGRFAAYATGMTITEALATGLTTADLVYDAAHGFVSFSGGTPAAAAVSATTEVQAEAAASEGEEQEAA